MSSDKPMGATAWGKCPDCAMGISPMDCPTCAQHFKDVDAAVAEAVRERDCMAAAARGAIKGRVDTRRRYERVLADAEIVCTYRGGHMEGVVPKALLLRIQDLWKSCVELAEAEGRGDKPDLPPCPAPEAEGVKE